VIEIATNQADCVFLCRLLSTVDDTKLLSEILKEIVSDIKNLCSNKYGCKVIFMLLCGISKRFFTEYEFTLLNLPSITSQKQPEVRRTELVKELNLQVRNIEGVDMILANLQEKGLKQAQKCQRIKFSTDHGVSRRLRVDRSHCVWFYIHLLLSPS